jgi:hypothetical protein
VLQQATLALKPQRRRVGQAPLGGSAWAGWPFQRWTEFREIEAWLGLAGGLAV